MRITGKICACVSKLRVSEYSNMPTLFLKKTREPEKVELGIEGAVEELLVRELRECVVEKLSISNEDLCLVYGGRVLKPGKTLGQYKAVNGCTIHVLTKQPDKKEEGAESSRAAGGSSLINNRRILRLIGRILSNPSVLQGMIEGTPLANSDAMRQAMSNPELLASLSDPDSIQQYLHSNPHMAIMMEGVLRAYSMLFGGTSGGEDQGDIVSMVENSLEEDMELAERDTAARELANAQEQMFEHSQALHAHQQQRHTHQSTEATPTQETSYNPSSSRQHGSVTVAGQLDSVGGVAQGGGGISHEQLASALAGAMSSSAQGSPLTSLNYSNPSGPSSLYSNQPSSLTSDVAGASSSTVTNQSRPITANNFQQALAGALSSIQSTPQRPENPPEQRLTLQEKYMAQLEQLHMMGIMDDAACLHALEATGGDLQSALELLYQHD